MRRLTVGKNDAAQRLDKFLKKITLGLPDSLLYKYLRKKCVKVNGKHVTEGAHLLKEGDEICLYMNEAFFVSPEESFRTLVPELSVAYEDVHLLVLEKPAGLSCHADDTQRENTLIDRAKAYLYRKGEYDPEAEQSFAPALANRIDRNTAGLVLCAKDAESLRVLSEMIRTRRITKEYRALVCGVPKPERGTLLQYLLKDETKKRVRVFDEPHPGAKTAVTEYELLHTDGEVSLVHVTLHTGRTHQIRAGFAHIGCPLLGDAKYGDMRTRDTRGFSHQALIAYRLVFHTCEADGVLRYLDNLSVTAKHAADAFEINTIRPAD